ncbi:VPGUxxT family thioredoxin-like (seleno)protein, type 2 [Winogradskyella immobilis]|uniref:Thioredoxin family protein n=1 Tax=Winogradskyella immobilis TaxID=2816852 RepID=A0ABS8EIY1_9FLAO|nr:VPGUxxT family thioredoxin-like (seleno)protein, type 2 [Winogradskyella immobilis]MCC1483151.1 thioredoxin family protein [Winogradskyella immobilis]MCG0015246.1 thioredoxin family protein [Winogradskyella immobilis]
MKNNARKNRTINHQILFIITILMSVTFISAQEKTTPGNQSEELGEVSWYRDYDTALELAEQQGKEVLILFQEVPGCATCRNYGHNVLSHPLMVEAIEDLFIPLAIYNNKGGKDKQILQKYKEPSWNNPVVRIVNKDGDNTVNRISGNYSAIALYKAMNESLFNANKPIPGYFKLLGDELFASNNKSAKETYFKMYCFWTGEKELGKIEGVLGTEAGFMGGHEVVKVKYDDEVIDKSKIAKYVRQVNFTPIAKSNYRTAKNDIQYYLEHTNYKYLPLTEVQKTKINSALGTGKRAEQYLSPKQLKWLKSLNNSSVRNEVLFNKDFVMAWKSKNKLASK